MNQKKLFCFKSFIIIGLIVLFTSGCEKEEEKISPINETNGKSTAVFNSNIKYGSCTDIDGNKYKTIVIGTQIWMAENLRTTRYQNGDTIFEITKDTIWEKVKTGAYGVYNNSKSLDTIATYGRLYNWYSVSDSRKIAPRGWHIPTADEWQILMDFIGSNSGKLKEIDTTHWFYAFNVTNETGFTALPGGTTHFFETYGDIGKIGYWWTSTGSLTPGQVYYAYISSIPNYIEISALYREVGMSIRCVKN